MTQPTLDQQRMEDAARSVGGKLLTFHEGLSPDEQAMLGAALWQGLREFADQPDDAGGYAYNLNEMMVSLKLMGEILSNVSKTRSEISMTFARNARA